MKYQDAILAICLSSYASLIGAFQLSFGDATVVKKNHHRHPALVRLSSNVDDSTVGNGSKEFCSLHPGIGIATIKLGNPEMARKAWKKRRRSSSPVLMPCSVLSVDRTRALRGNVMYILNRYGETLKENLGGGKGGGDGISMRSSDVVKKYRSVLGGALRSHAEELGFDTVGEMLMDLFDEKATKDYGVEVVEKNGGYILMSSLSKRRARAQSASCGIAEVVFRPNENMAQHTGYVRVRRGDDRQSGLELLSAAVRVSPKDSERYDENDTFNAFVFSFDQDGDAGEPLLIMTPEPTREQIKDGIRRKINMKKQRDARTHKLGIEANLLPIDKGLNELKTGDGPYVAKVVNISSKAKAAFVDLGVGRPRGKAQGGGQSNVLGMLRFTDLVDNAVRHGLLDEEEDIVSDAISDDEDDDVESLDDLFMSDDDVFSFGDEDEEEEEEEIVEDVTDLFELDEDGNMFEIDDETGEKKEIGSIMAEGDDYDEDDDDDDLFAGMSPEERLEAIQSMLEEEENQEAAPDDDDGDDDETEVVGSGTENAAPLSLSLGDEIEVYISNVSTQSGRFMVTLDPSIKGKKAVDMKNEKNANKRLSKLASQFGDEGMEKIISLRGTECDGIVKAKSRTGDWFYVQPDGEHQDLPVGVASVDADDLANIATIHPGDRVRIRFEGIDDLRGQLAMSLVDRL